MNKSKKTIVDLTLKDLAAPDWQSTGFQATHIGDAAAVIRKMKEDNATVFLGFTANLMATGLRGLVADLCRKKFVDIIVTTAGSISHDVIKSFVDYKAGNFLVDDVALNKKGINRLGNIFISHSHYELFEKKIQPVFKKLYAQNHLLCVQALTQEIGSHLNQTSFLYWCARNGIPVFAPGITDGAIGLQAFFFKQNHSNFGIDVLADTKTLVDRTLNADKTGAIILGGGITKHHIIGANLLRDGLDYAVYVNTAQEFDGSLSGAQTREAQSWGKIRANAKTVNVHCDATIAFPLIIRELQKQKII